MRSKTKGIIIREQSVKESDRLVTLLSADQGMIRAFVRQANKVTSRLNAATSLFAYGTFSVYQGKSAYIIDDARVEEMFFPLREDIDRLALAQYFAQLAAELIQEEQEGEESLRLLLNAFYLLCRGKTAHPVIKAAVEFRMLALNGYMPALLGCDKCGAYEAEPMHFSLEHGTLACQNCNTDAGALPMSRGVLSAVRHICLSDAKKVFAYRLSQEGLDSLSRLAQRYVQAQIGRRLSTLDFYESLAKPMM